MNNSAISKDTATRGIEAMAVFKDAGVTYSARYISNFYPIVFAGITAGTANKFTLKDTVTRDYEILGIQIDIPADNEDSDKNILNNTAEFNAVFFSYYLFPPASPCPPLVYFPWSEAEQGIYI